MSFLPGEKTYDETPFHPRPEPDGVRVSARRLRQLFDGCADLVCREVSPALERAERVTVMYLDGLADGVLWPDSGFLRRKRSARGAAAEAVRRLLLV